MAKSKNIERLDFEGLAHYDEKIKNHIEENLSEATDSIKGELNSKAPQSEVDDIKSKIPTQASSSNQLADKNFVNSSIATSTAEFKGTHDSLDSLQAVSADANDYGFVKTKDSDGNTVFKRYKYVDGAGWVWEYDLNNSSFTANQWAAIQSGITSSDVQKIKSIDNIVASLSDMQSTITNLKTKLDAYPDLSKAATGKTVAFKDGQLEEICETGYDVMIQAKVSATALAARAIQNRQMPTGLTAEEYEELRELMGDEIFDDLSSSAQATTLELHPEEEKEQAEKAMLERVKAEYLEQKAMEARNELQVEGDKIQDERVKKDVETDKNI